MNDIRTLWQVHRGAEWPNFSDPNRGALMTLDTVISGCVTYYLEENGLDPQRLAILRDCLADLEGFLPDLSDEVATYFDRLRMLARLMLDTGSAR